MRFNTDGRGNVDWWERDFVARATTKIESYLQSSIVGITSQGDVVVGRVDGQQAPLLFQEVREGLAVEDLTWFQNGLQKIFSSCTQSKDLDGAHAILSTFDHLHANVDEGRLDLMGARAIPGGHVDIAFTAVQSLHAFDTPPHFVVIY